MTDELKHEYAVVLSLKSAGDLFIDNKDIIDCYFIEDIYSFCSFGKLIFNDRYGISEGGPFTGNEYVTIIYSTMDKKVRVFDIFKVNKIQQASNVESGIANTFEVSFVDNIFRKMTKKRFSLSWSDTKVSTIIKDITNNILEYDFNIFEETSNSLSFYSPYWTPQEAISWLLKRGKSSKTETSGYLYYYDINEGVNYLTLESLLRNTTLLKLSVGTVPPYETVRSVLWIENKTVRTSGQNVENKDKYQEHPINKIFEWEILGIDNTGTNDVFGKHMLGFNSSTKSFIDNSYKYSDSVLKYTMLGRDTLFPGYVDNENSEYVLIGESDSDIIDNIYYHNFIKKYSVQQCLSVTLPGHEGRYPGAMVEVKWPSAFEDSSVVYSKVMSGKYLIKSITHSFTPDASMGYRQQAVLIKNAYYESPYSGLIESNPSHRNR